MYDPEYRRYSIDFDKITGIISKLESRGYENVQLFPEITNLDKLSTILSPAMDKTFGNISETPIKKVIEMNDFKKLAYS